MIDDAARWYILNTTETTTGTIEYELTQVFGIIMVVVAIVLAFALQVYVFKRLRKNAGTLTALSVLQNS